MVFKLYRESASGWRGSGLVNPGKCLILAAALLPSAWFAFHERDVPHFGLLMDDAIYAASGRELASAGDYRFELLVHQPAQTKFPPLYPALLGGVWRAAPDFPANLPWMLLVTWLSFAIAVLLTPGILERLGLPEKWALTGGALFAVNPYAVFYGSSLMAELPFLVLFYLTVRAADQRPAAAGVLAGIGYLCRGAGILLLPAGVLHYAWKRRWRECAEFAASMAPFLVGWMAWSRANRTQETDYPFVYNSDYFGYYFRNTSWSDLPVMLDQNFQTLLVSLGRLLWFDLGDSMASMYGKSLVTLIAVFGVVSLARRTGMHLHHWFALGTLALVVIWNTPPNERLVLALLPVAIAGLLQTARTIWEEHRRLAVIGGVHRVVAVASTVIFGIAGASLVRDIAGAHTGYLPSILARERQRMAMERPVLEWMRVNLPPGQSAVTCQEGRLYFYAGLRALPMPLPPKLAYSGTADAKLAYFQSFEPMAAAHGVRYVYSTPWDFEFDLDGAAQARWRKYLDTHGRLEALYQHEGVTIYEVATGDSGRDSDRTN